MGSCISAIYDDHEDYESLCEYIGVKPIGIRDGDWYKHRDAISVANGLKSHEFRQIFSITNPIKVEGETYGNT